MPGRTKSGAKRVANVDRYGRNVRSEAGEAGAEDASVVSNDEVLSDKEVPTVLDTDDEEHEAPPKEWTLADGSPVFRAGKKNLRLDPRKNRRAHGEDSDEYEREERRARGEPVTPREATPPPIVPVELPARPIAIRSPTMPRAKRSEAARPATPPKTKPTTTSSPLSLPLFLLALLLAILLGALILYLLTGIGGPTVINFVGSRENTTTLETMISENSVMLSLSTRVQTLETSFKTLSTDLTNLIHQKSQENLDKLNKQKDVLTKELETLKTDLALKITQSQLDDTLSNKLAQQKKEFDKEIDQLKKRIEDLKIAPTPTSTPTSTPAASTTAITELQKNLETLKNHVETISNDLNELKKLKTNLKTEIAQELSSEDSQAKIVAAINKRLATHGAANEMNVDALAESVLKNSNSLQQSVKDLTALRTRVDGLETWKNTVPPTANVDLSGIEARLNKLSQRIDHLASTSTQQPATTTNELTPLINEWKIELKSLTTIVNNIQQTPSASQADVTKLERQLNDLNAKVNSGSIKAEILTQVRSDIAREIAARVASGSAAVALPDHALFNNGARPFKKAIGWAKEQVPLFERLFGSTRVYQAPSIALHPDMAPGSCYPIEDQAGTFAVMLPYQLTPTAFTIDHILASESLVKGAMPKTFTIYGAQDSYTSFDVENLTELASGSYKEIGPTAQTFYVSSPSSSSFNVFLLNITSNYGATYTCLYRFRVHGQASNP